MMCGPNFVGMSDMLPPEYWASIEREAKELQQLIPADHHSSKEENRLAEQTLYELLNYYRSIGRPEVTKHLSKAYLEAKNWE